MDGSILSFPDRGEGGDPRYPGNCSPRVIQTLVEHLKPRFVVDPMEGSGTTRDVCAGLGLRYLGLDLKDGFDLEAQPLRDVLPAPADLVFLHPPYHDMIRYSGEVWGERRDPRDLSACASWDEFERRLGVVVRSCQGALSPCGHLAVLVGDLRRGGRYWSLLPAVLGALPGDSLQGILIKLQHHCRSDLRRYGGAFIPIRHEYLVVFRAGAQEGAPWIR